MHFQPEIRSAQPGDAQGIHNLIMSSRIETYPNPEYDITAADIQSSHATYEDPAQVELLDETIALPDPTVLRLVALADDTIVASVKAVREHEEHGNLLDLMFMDRPWHGTGLADRMMDETLEWFGDQDPISLYVISYNLRAVRFYARHGFVVDPNNENLQLPLPTGKILPVVGMIRVV